MKLLCLCGLLVLAEEDGHDDHEDHSGHGHGDGAAPYEWGGIFETPEDGYVWVADKVGDDYADPSMKLVALPVTAATAEELEKQEAEAKHSFEETCTVLNNGGTIVPAEHACFELTFDASLPTTMFKVDASDAKHIAFYTAHVPTEFERDMHYFKDLKGVDIEPQAELSGEEEAEEEPVDFGAPIVASIIVNMVTFCGVVFAVPVFKKLSEDHADAFTAIVSAFAGGAMMACAFYLLLFESTHLIAVAYTEEVDTLWRWGTAILGGYSLPFVTQSFASAVVPDAVVPAAKEGDDLKKGTMVVSRSRILSGVLIGDFFHNLCDGFFLGAAFKGCGANFGWSVAIGTVAHELAQELADYVILTGQDAKLRTPVALLLNFLSGMSVLLGCIIILSADVSQEATGLLLAFGGGVYLHVAATECIPKCYIDSLSVRTRLGSLGAFLLGSLGIGLVLLGHEHCVPEGGHAHGH